MSEMPERIWAERDDETDAKRWYSVKGMGVEYVRADEPDIAKSVAEVIAEESANGAAAGWRSCTGCHETNEGYETGHYPYSKMFGCFVGSGCSECGGIGVTWEYWSEDELAAMLEDTASHTQAALSSAAVAEREPVALTPTALADAFDAMWNAVLGVSNERQEGMAVASMLAKGFSAMGRVLRDNVPTPPTSELEAENARLRDERDDFKDEWQAELEKRKEMRDLEAKAVALFWSVPGDHLIGDIQSLRERATTLQAAEARLAEALKALELIERVPQSRPKSGHLYECSWCNGSASIARRVREGGNVDG